MAIGKWIGGFLGLLQGGPLGALAGFALGAMMDAMMSGGGEAAPDVVDPQRQAEGERNGFLFALMVLAAHVMHADGRVMHSEMEHTRRFLRLQFSPQAESEGEAILLRLLQEKKRMGEAQWQVRMQDVCRQLAGVMPREQRLQLVSLLCSLAQADGHVHPAEREALAAICAGLELEAGTADQLLGLGGASLDDAYQALGLTPQATDDEVRRAYKRMALEHHPDRVASLGEDVRAAAQRKFQALAEAKDRIYKARGMK